MEIIGELEERGIVLKSEVCTMIAGEPVRGSWWAHPRSHEMFRVMAALAEHPDVLIAKLVSGKDTFIHRAFWPAVLAIGAARESWQMKMLDVEARALLASLDSLGALQATGKSALKLEQALLVHGEQVHTAKGSHAKVLTSWKRWARRQRVKAMDVADAKLSLEKLVDHLNRRSGGRERLPWR